MRTYLEGGEGNEQRGSLNYKTKASSYMYNKTRETRDERRTHYLTEVCKQK